MKKFSQIVESINRDRDLQEYIMNISMEKNNPIIKNIKEIFTNKLNYFKTKFRPEFNDIILDFEDCYQDDIAACVNDYQLNVIHINMWRIFKEIQDLLDNSNIEQIKEKVISFINKNKIIAHELAHIVDVKKNGTTTQHHGISFKKELNRLLL